MNGSDDRNGDRTTVSLSEDEVRRICSDELVRMQARELSSATPQSSKAWRILNSSFAIFVMSSIGLSSFTFALTSCHQRHERIRADEETARRLDTEIAYRLGMLARLTKPQFTYTEVFSARSALTGDREDDPEIGRIDEFTPIFTEYRNRTLASLIWELSRCVNSDTAQLAKAIEAARALPDVCTLQVMDQVQAEGSDDSIWQFQAGQQDRFASSLRVLQAINRWRNLVS